MATQIFVNLPVKDLNKSIEFFTKLGYTFNPHFSNEKGACLIISDTIYAMLLTKPFFQTFTKKEIADATRTTEVILALSMDSREDVDEMIRKALEAGGTMYTDPTDHGFMYQNSFADLDGHQWEYFWFDPKAEPGQQ